MKRALFLLLVACGRGDARRDAAPLGEDPARRLTETECGIAIDHAIGLAGNVVTELREDRATRVAQCVEHGTLRDFLCLMNATSLKDLGGCGQAP